MGKLSWGLFFFTLFLLLIKLAVAINGEYGFIISMYRTNDLSFNIIWSNVIATGILMFPLLILVSVLGLISRKKLGFVVALLLPYFILAHAMTSFVSITHWYGNFDGAQILFSFLILIPLNVILALEGVFSKVSIMTQLMYNLIPFLLGLTFIISFSYYLDLLINT